jgi:hypothetical protein
MPAWVASESKWEKAKKLARKQYPGVTGDAFWARVAGIYKQMGGKVEKSRKLGDKHAKHSYLQERANLANTLMRISPQKMTTMTIRRACLDQATVTTTRTTSLLRLLHPSRMVTIPLRKWE